MGPGDPHQLAQGCVQVAGQALEVGDRAEMGLEDPLRPVAHQPVDRCVQRIGLELHWRRGRQHERSAVRIELAVADAEIVAAVDFPVIEVDWAVVVPGVAGRIDELERAASELKALAVLGHDHALRRDRDQLAVQPAVKRFAVDLDRARDQPGRIDQVGRTARVQHGPGIRQRPHQLAGPARMVEVDVGQEQVVDLSAIDADFVERCEQPGGSRSGAGIDERRAAVVDHEVTRGETRAQVEGVDQEHPVAQRLGQRGRRIGGQRPLHFPWSRVSLVEHRLGRWLE